MFLLVAAVVTQAEADAISAPNLSGNEKVDLAAIGPIINKYNLKRGISFHGRVSSATRFCHTLKQVYKKEKLYVNTINGKTQANRGSNILREMAQYDKALITNVRVLGEGFDYTALDYLIMVDPKSSIIDVVQNFGRVMRKHDGKEIGTIVLPILVENEDANILSVVNNGKFGAIYSIAASLEAMDETFSSELNTSGRGETQGRRIRAFTVNGYLNPATLIASE